MHASSVTRLCDKLVAAGLVSREHDEQDRRVLNLTLTDAGKASVERVLDARAEEILQILSVMAPSARASLPRALPALLAASDEVLAGNRDWLG